MGAKIEEQYIGGIVLEKVSIRKYKYTVKNGEYKGLIFFSETVTERISEHEWGNSDTIYYVENGEEFKSVDDLLKSLKE